jgi:hypothetical protein
VSKGKAYVQEVIERMVHGNTRNAKWALQERAYSTPSKLSLTSRSEYSKLETIEGEQEAQVDGNEWPHFA